MPEPTKETVQSLMEDPHFFRTFMNQQFDEGKLFAEKEPAKRPTAPKAQPWWKRLFLR